MWREGHAWHGGATPPRPSAPATCVTTTGSRGLVRAETGARTCSLLTHARAYAGTFVGTDITFKDNFLMPFFGVTDSMSDLEGCIRAGASTSAGFMVMQTGQNLVLPKGANWIDPVKI